MMNWFFSAIVGLASAQVILYRLDSKRALKTFGFLGFFYFFLFAFVEGLKIFCALFSISFYDLALLSITLFLVFGREVKGFPAFEPRFKRAPGFYLFTSLFMSLIWFSFPEPAPDLFIRAFTWSFFAALLIPMSAGMKDRLQLLKPRDELHSLTLFLLAAGILLLALTPWIPLLIYGRP